MGVVAAVLFVLTAVLASLGVMLLVRRTAQPSALEAHHEVAGLVYAVTTGVYAVLLAFVVIVAWQGQQTARVRAEQEANALVDLYRGTRALTPGPELRRGLREYAEEVVRAEWPAMGRGERLSPAAQRAYEGVWRAYLGVRPRGDYENAWYGRALDRLGDLGDERRLRLLAGQSSLPPLMWGVLWAGALMTVGFSYLFSIRSVWSQGVTVSALSGTLALILFLVMALDRPFSGAIRVESAAFEQAIRIFDGLSKAEAAP